MQAHMRVDHARGTRHVHVYMAESAEARLRRPAEGGGADEQAPLELGLGASEAPHLPPIGAKRELSRGPDTRPERMARG